MRHFATTLMAFGIMVAALPAARADNTPCTGSLQGVINGNVVVPDGATCQLNNATVTGNVFVSTGASLAMGVLGSVMISGNLQADHCASVGVISFTTSLLSIGGNVAIRSCTEMSGYDVSSGSSGSVTIGGNFLCQTNSAPCFAQRGSIGGNTIVSGNFGGTSIVAGNEIGGNLLCLRNTAVIDSSAPNTVFGKKLGQCAGANF
jgi:hypothetical protein